MYVCWEQNRKEELAQLLEWQHPSPEGSIQSLMALKRDYWKVYHFMEATEASKKKPGIRSGLVYLAPSEC